MLELRLRAAFWRSPARVCRTPGAVASSPRGLLVPENCSPAAAKIIQAFTTQVNVSIGVMSFFLCKVSGRKLVLDADCLHQEATRGVKGVGMAVRVNGRGEAVVTRLTPHVHS